MFFLKIQSENVCFLIGVFGALIIIVITDIVSAILDLFSLSHLLFLYFFLPSLRLVKYFILFHFILYYIFTYIFIIFISSSGQSLIVDFQKIWHLQGWGAAIRFDSPANVQGTQHPI